MGVGCYGASMRQAQAAGPRELTPGLKRAAEPIIHKPPRTCRVAPARCLGRSCRGFAANGVLGGLR